MKRSTFSGAGCRRKPDPRCEVHAAQFGILPDTGNDQTQQVQHALDTLGAGGGGVLLFAPGEYAFDSPIRINHSHLIMRGMGNATRLKLRRPQTQQKFSPWLSPALITAGTKLQSTEKFWGVKALSAVPDKNLAGAGGIAMTGDLQEPDFLTAITRVVDRRNFRVAEAENLHAGDFVLVTMRNTDDDGTLLKQLLDWHGAFHPLQRAALLAGPTRAASFQFLAEVEAVADDRITLTSPLPEELDTAFAPALYAAPLLTGIGVESLTLCCDWRGPYLLHGGGVYSVTEGNEMDYGWSAVKLFRCAHSRVSRLEIEDFTSAVELIDSRNVTVEEIVITDTTPHGGHYGVKVYCHAEENLFRNIRLEAFRTHAISCEGNACGNLFQDFTVANGDLPEVSEFDLPGFADLPFAPPGHNRFERISGIGRITGGGGKFNLPHSGRGNTFSDIRFDLRGKALFYSWIAEDTKQPDRMQFPGTMLDNIQILPNGPEQ